MWEFARESPGITLLITMVVVVGLKGAYSRTMRMLMVRKHGWPPAHLDADGDWRPATDET